MEFRKLGQGDLAVSRICFGCWAIGGHGYGTVDDRLSIRAVRKALDIGINFFDTANVYGLGHSEKVLSKALGAQRHEAVIATKFGVCFDREGKSFKDCSPNQALLAIEGSLRRLKVDSIPLYQIHWHDGRTSLGDIIEVLERCREAGKIKHIGCCNFPMALINASVVHGRIATVQYLLNLVQKENERNVHYLFERGLSVLAYGVLSRGLFSGKYDADSVFGRNDTRSYDPQFRGEELTKNLRIVEELKSLGRIYRKSAAQVAIRWVLDAPFVTSAILGMKTEEQVEENVKAIGWRLDDIHRAALSNLGDGDLLSQS